MTRPVGPLCLLLLLCGCPDREQDAAQAEGREPATTRAKRSNKAASAAAEEATSAAKGSDEPSSGTIVLEPATITMGAPRAADWPCSVTYTFNGKPTSKATLVYGGPAKCSIPVGVDMYAIGCPTVIRTRHREGIAHFLSIDTRLLYAPDGRLARTESHQATAKKVSHTNEIHYTQSGEVAALLSRGHVQRKWTYKKREGEVILENDDERTTYRLDARGRVVSRSRRITLDPSFVETATYEWRGSRLQTVRMAVPGGRTAVWEYAYDCGT